MESDSWRWMVRQGGNRMDRELGPALTTLFFSDYQLIDHPRGYLAEEHMVRAAPFFPLLMRLIESAPVLWVAIVTLNFFEVAPSSVYLPVLTRAARFWFGRQGTEAAFWVDGGIGRRFCAVVVHILQTEPAVFALNSPLRAELDHLVAAMVRAGVAEAHRLEQALARG